MKTQLHQYGSWLLLLAAITTLLPIPLWVVIILTLLALALTLWP